jgi:MFS family permease
VSGRWRLLDTLLVASGLVMLDGGILLIALPTIQRMLGATPGEVGLAIAVYQIAFGVAVVATGRAGDIWGRRRVALVGVGGFTVSSALCAVAPTPGALIACRAVQGLCGALIVPQAGALVQVAFPAQERPRAFARIGAVIGTASIAGPAAGGLVLAMDPAGLGWRAALLLNVPIGVAAWLHLARRLPVDARQAEPRRLDVLGAALLGGGLFALLHPLLTAGGGAWSGVELAAAAPLLGAFWMVERKRGSRDGIVPLLSVRLLADRRFRAATAVAVLLFGAAAAFSFVLALYAQHGLGMTPLGASVVAFASPVGSLAAMYGYRWLDGRLGSRTAATGFAIVVASTAAMTALASVLHGPVAGFWLVPVVALSGAGFGMITPRLSAFAVGTVAPSDAGAAAGAMSSVQTLSRAVAVSVVGSFFFALVAAGSSSADAALPAPVAACVQAQLDRGDGAGARLTCVTGPAAGEVRETVDTAVGRAFGSGYGWGMALVTALFVIGLAIAARAGTLAPPGMPTPPRTEARS